MLNDHVLLAFGLTVFAGLSTGVGSLMAFFSKKFSPRFLCATLGFSAGVMVYVSFVEIFVKARVALSAAMGDKTGYWLTVLAFFAGIAIVALIDALVPSFENPHELKHIDQADYSEQDKRKLLRMGMFSALAIALHNFPEGLGTFMSALQDPKLGISIAIAMAIHNIPEGIAVSVPIYFATKSRGKAFWLSLGSGLSEPIGALLGYVVLRAFFNDLTFGLVFAAVAGIMVYISLDELLPTAEEYGHHHLVIGGVIGGMAVMALSLLLFV